MKKHLLLIGFSCTGKTSLGKEAFAPELVIDSDRQLCRWIEQSKGKKYGHIYEIFMDGRKDALLLIAEAEETLIDEWAADVEPKIISLGLGFPLHANWPRLRAVSCVVLFRRSAEEIYNNLIARRDDIFKARPQAKEHDNWDVDVIVDEHRREHPKEKAIANIKGLLSSRERRYGDNDQEVCTDDRENAIRKLKDLRKGLECIQNHRMAE